MSSQDPFESPSGRDDVLGIGLTPTSLLGIVSENALDPDPEKRAKAANVLGVYMNVMCHTAEASWADTIVMSPEQTQMCIAPVLQTVLETTPDEIADATRQHFGLPPAEDTGEEKEPLFATDEENFAAIALLGGVLGSAQKEAKKPLKEQRTVKLSEFWDDESVDFVANRVKIPGKTKEEIKAIYIGVRNKLSGLAEESWHTFRKAERKHAREVRRAGE